MTALCLSCGDLKPEPLGTCRVCSSEPLDVSTSVAFTDSHFTPSCLSQLGQAIRAIRAWSDNSDFVFWTFIAYVSREHPEILEATPPSELSAEIEKALGTIKFPHIRIEIVRSAPAITLPEWLEEKATAAPTMMRVAMDILQPQFERDFPEVLISPGWASFRMLGTVAGCGCLATRLHRELPRQYRTSVELKMREYLELGFPGADRHFEDCARYVRGNLLQVERSKRSSAIHTLEAAWVFGVLNDDDQFQNHNKMVATLASFLENELDGYWLEQGAANTTKEQNRPTETIPCARCKQKLRVPSSDRRLTIRCPTCQHQFEFKGREA